MRRVFRSAAFFFYRSKCRSTVVEARRKDNLMESGHAPDEWENSDSAPFA
jgi:hypothetical protein